MKNPSLSSLPVYVLVILAVVLAIQIILAIIALRDLCKRSVDEIVFSNKWIWVAIILLANLLGPILYFVAGRKPAIVAEQTGAAPSHQSENIADLLYGRKDETK